MSKIKKAVRAFLKIFFKKKPSKIKKSIEVSQTNEQLKIKGKLDREHYQVKELWFNSRQSDRIYKFVQKSLGSTFDFSVDLSEIGVDTELEREDFDLFLFVRVPQENLSEKKIIKLLGADTTVDLVENGTSYLEYPIRVGKFEETFLNGLVPVETNGTMTRLYVTRANNLTYSVNINYLTKPKTSITKLNVKKKVLTFQGKFFTRNAEITEAYLVLVGRNNNGEIVLPIDYQLLKEEKIKTFGLNRYSYDVVIDLGNSSINERDLHEDIYDYFFQLHLNDRIDPELVRVGNPSFKAKLFTKGMTEFQKEDKTFAFFPYFTHKRDNLSSHMIEFERDTYAYLKKMVTWYWLIRPFYAKKNIWVVGEMDYKAQDTGYHFFRYMRETFPEKNVFYVIDKASPERENVEPYGNILDFKSKEHIFHVLMAQRIVGSHHPDYLYPLRTDEFKKKVKAKKVFLQHGVMGTKNSTHFYGVHSPTFEADLFMVSSKFEKEMIVKDFGYDPYQVKVTGLSRFDTLLDGKVECKRQILIIPTWREWLMTEHAFLESEYYERYKNIINDPRLKELAEKHNFTILFCLHPNMQKYSKYFLDSFVKVIFQGEVDVQHLMKESAMMITDYSSVAFDFSFLEKPIIYYQFDRSRFIGKKGSHLDLDNDLPGEIVFDLEQLLFFVKTYAETNFEMPYKYKIRAEKFLDYKDLQSNERIYNAITQTEYKKNVLKSFINHELSRKIFEKYRKSKVYYPSMKWFYKFAKTFLPIDQNLIVFESGIGKQYADSPRYIYEQLVKQNSSLKKVWFYNRNEWFNDENTIRVKRLSPQYYYYLARAKYWVNNQNFPTYISKRKGTTYLQTWHGTPLKKMLHDIKNVQGRSDDYVERVSSAISHWDYLISPSAYATNAFKSAFQYNGEVLEVGYPRNDLFYKSNTEQEAIVEKIKRKYKIDPSKKVILYAPTFRDNQKNKNKFVFELPFDLEEFKERFSDEYVLLLRMHVLVSSKVKISAELRDFVFNVSGYPEIQDLYLTSDILITDYSSVMFDYANSNRPILFYTYDLGDYRDNIRGFYMDFEQEAPGPLLMNQEELFDTLSNIENVSRTYETKYQSFQQKFCYLEDGQASRRVVEKIFAK